MHIAYKGQGTFIQAPPGVAKGVGVHCPAPHSVLDKSFMISRRLMQLDFDEALMCGIKDRLLSKVISKNDIS